jgi:hypothetical protein
MMGETGGLEGGFGAVHLMGLGYLVLAPGMLVGQFFQLRTLMLSSIAFHITMANSVAIPQDIIDTIIDAVGDDTRSRKKCALVSSSFFLPSRKHLFSKISLRLGRKGGQVCQRLHQFFVENPVIQSFVRSIAINQDWGCQTSESHLQLNSTSLIAILQLPFYCLESFSVNMMWYPLNWNDFSSELKDALSTIIHLSTLKTVYLEKVNLPIMHPPYETIVDIHLAPRF